MNNNVNVWLNTVPPCTVLYVLYYGRTKYVVGRNWKLYHTPLVINTCAIDIPGIVGALCGQENLGPKS
jgi:hypothetical protein